MISQTFRYDLYLKRESVWEENGQFDREFEKRTVQCQAQAEWGGVRKESLERAQQLDSMIGVWVDQKIGNHPERFFSPLENLKSGEGPLDISTHRPPRPKPMDQAFQGSPCDFQTSLSETFTHGKKEAPRSPAGRQVLRSLFFAVRVFMDGCLVPEKPTASQSSADRGQTFSNNDPKSRVDSIFNFTGEL